MLGKARNQIGGECRDGIYFHDRMFDFYALKMGVTKSSPIIFRLIALLFLNRVITCVFYLFVLLLLLRGIRHRASRFIMFLYYVLDTMSQRAFKSIAHSIQDVTEA